MQSGDRTVEPPEAAMSLARKAYFREPLSVEALEVLAQSMFAEDRNGGATAIATMREITRRSLQLNLDLAIYYAERGRSADALDIFNVILRRKGAVYGQLIEQMAALAGDPNNEADLAMLLAPDPPWANDLWRQIAQSSAGLQNAAGLRLAVAERGGRVEREIDEMLVVGLVGQARFDDARRVAKATLARGKREIGLTNTLSNENFSARPVLVPFDWATINTGEFGADLQARKGQVVISALPGSSGVVMEQLVELSANSLLLAASVPDPETFEDGLSVQVDCAQPSQQELLRKSLPFAKGVSFAARGCRWAWVRVGVELPLDSQGREWSIDSFRLTELD